MLFSVVIPTFNRRELLAEALCSVWAQTFTDYEVIVVDDGSTDGTWDYLSSLREEIIAVRQENRGPGAARNAGAKLARGDYVAFLDADDIWFPWTLAAFAESLMKFPSLSLIVGEWVEFSSKGGLPTIPQVELEATWHRDYFASSGRADNLGSGLCVIAREALLRNAFLEDRLNCEDHDLFIRMGTEPSYLKINAPPTLAYRRHHASETAEFEQTLRGVRRLLERERRQEYPGGYARALERHRILMRHVRPVALGCLREGLLQDGLRLYRQTLIWNLRLRHVSFAFGFPLLMLVAWHRRRQRSDALPALN